MQTFIKHTGIVAPIDRSNIDTDAIIPKQFLKRIERTGFGKHLFHEWRYLDYEGIKENPDFILNKNDFRKATILLTRDNFGCGSSREHAPWALSDFGFRAVIAPSFADIFSNNSFKNGILLVKLSNDEISKLFSVVNGNPVEFTIDLPKQYLIDSNGNEYKFNIDPFAKEFLVKGLDQIGWTLQFEEDIKKFEAAAKKDKPWL